MVDLRSQYDKIKDQVDHAIQQVVDTGAYINGPEVKSFEKELATYLSASYAIGCGNGTDALQIALMALDLKPGDEVITTPFTFVATAEVIQLLGLKAIFVDIDEKTFNIDPALIEQAITPKTKCIIPVHLFGQAANMEAIMDIAKTHGLHVVEDNAQAIGGTYTFTDGTVNKTGTLGDIGCLSFYPSKNLGCYGDGGAINTSNETLHAAIRTIANHGSDRRYYYDRVGVNSRLDSIQAAVLRIKLERLDAYIDSRIALADAYDLGLAEIEEVTTPYRDPSVKHVFHQYTIRCKDRRNELQQYLTEHQVPNMIYYPVPLHMSKPYQNEVNQKGAFPVTELAAEEVLSLPMHTEMDREQSDHIVELIYNFYKK